MDTKKIVELRWIHYVYEFFIVAIGISVPFLLDRWNDQRLEKKAERENYRYILQELREDKSELQHVADYNLYYLGHARQASKIILEEDKSQMDTLGRLAIDLRYVSDFHRNHSIYENLINSEKIKSIQNTSLINQLQNLDEQYTYINRLEGNHLQVVINTALPTISQYLSFDPYQVADENALFSYPFHNLVVLLASVMQEKAELYERTLARISEIEAAVSGELERK